MNYLLLVVGLTGAMAVASAANEPVDLYLTESGILKAPLELRTGQEGIVGITGEVWRCSESGKWTIAQYVNDKISEPKQSGQLTKDKLRQLASALAAHDFDKLPAEFGRDLKVNRQLISVTFGKKTATCVLNPGETMKAAMPPKSDPKAATWARFIQIEQSIQDQLKGEAKRKSKPGSDDKKD